MLQLLHRFKAHKPQFVVRFQHTPQHFAHICNREETHSTLSLRIPVSQRKSVRNFPTFYQVPLVLIGRLQTWPNPTKINHMK